MLSIIKNYESLMYNQVEYSNLSLKYERTHLNYIDVYRKRLKYIEK